MVSSKTLCAATFLACVLKFGATQTSCKGRCGAEYYRGYICQCDYTCLVYGECCEDYESKCTTKNSCMGRCGEAFKRGRLCSCDSNCMKYKQCCPDFNSHCDAEEMSGAASATAPLKTSSCDNINDSKPKGTFSLQNPWILQYDNIIPLDSPTSNPPDDLTYETYSQIIPSDEFSNYVVEDPEASTIPESSSGYGPPTTEPLDQTPTDPTLGPETELTTEPVRSDDANLSTLYPTTEEPTADARDLTTTSDQGTAFPQPTVSTDPDSSLLISTSVPETVPATSTDAPEIMTSSLPSDEPEVTTVSVQDSDTVPASVLASTAIPEETTSNSDTENNSEDVTTDAPSIMSSSTTPPELEAAMIQNSSSTAAVPEDTTLNYLKPPQNPWTNPAQPKKPLTPKPETKPVDPQTLNVDDPRNYQADDSNDTNLCSGRPVGGVTTLSNGTVVVFRGHFFWFLDRNREPSPARGITEVWGVPSPIDTVFTRCNCQGKTYILKGGRYWRFENDVLDAGYPRVIKTGFDGLQGHITAALSVPQYQNRRESVYFFKRGGFVQKYSYQFGTTPKCGRKVDYPIYTVRTRKTRQAVSVLEPAIRIRTSWRGFPSTITAAVSLPSTREPDGYKYFVFSRSKSYNVRLDSERPVITAPKQNAPPQTNDVFRCPTKS
ncbi:proteoglycan 4b [Xenentodon cancila]